MDQLVGHPYGSGLSLCVAGCAPDTGNLGVSALLLSILHACASYAPDARITVLDNGRGGGREDSVSIGGRRIRFTRCGANMSRRYHRSDNLVNMRLSAALGGLGNPTVRAIREADAVLDVSGGDSFTDLYGARRFKSMTIPKALAIKLGTPLIFVPQTYGPFEHEHTRAVAQRLVKAAKMAWARDTRNFNTLQELVGDDFDPARHRSGVDVAFALPKESPSNLPSWLCQLLHGPRERPLIGLNVSGLIYNNVLNASRQFGFTADYHDLIHGFLDRLVCQTKASILLIPHVTDRHGSVEADTPACRAVAERFASTQRVYSVEDLTTATELKWLIANMDYFCGTRMHSTIAGLSSAVPTSAIAYSKKTLGVFESCGQGAHVADPRHHDTKRCIDMLWAGWKGRAEMGDSLRKHIPEVLERANTQNREIFQMIHLGRSSTPAGP